MKRAGPVPESSSTLCEAVSHKDLGGLEFSLVDFFFFLMRGILFCTIREKKQIQKAQQTEP